MRAYTTRIYNAHVVASTPSHSLNCRPRRREPDRAPRLRRLLRRRRRRQSRRRAGPGTSRSLSRPRLAHLSPQGLHAGWPTPRRHATTQLDFTSGTELVVGYGLLLSFRLLERRRGSAAFAAHSLASASLAALLQSLCATALPPLGFPRLRLAPGLYAFLFASLPLFAADVPVLQRFSLGPLTLTDKSFTLAAAAHHALCKGWRSLLPALCGLVAGHLISRCAGTSALRALRNALAAVGGGVSRVLSPLRSQKREVARGDGHGAPRRARRAREARGGGHGGPAEAVAGQGPSAVASLCAMGFAEEAVVQALRLADGNVNRAAELLLSE